MMRVVLRRGALALVLVVAACTPTSCNVSQIFDPSGPDAVVSSKPIGTDAPDRGGGGQANLFQGSCPVGLWTRQVCGGGITASIAFRNDGTGYFTDRDCNTGCDREFRFNWSASGGSVTLSYFYARVCGQTDPIPTGGSQAFSCSGDLLTVGATYVRATTAFAPSAPSRFESTLALLGHNPAGWQLAIGGCGTSGGPPTHLPLTLPMLLAGETPETDRG
jgi:hypothetical protein